MASTRALDPAASAFPLAASRSTTAAAGSERNTGCSPYGVYRGNIQCVEFDRPQTLMARGGKRLLIGVPVLAAAGIGAAWWALHTHSDSAATRDLLSHYCVDCHNPTD